MAGQNHIPVTNSLNHRPDRRRLPPPTEIHLIEDRIAAQSREIQTLLLDNQRLAATHVGLKQDVAAAQQDLLRLSAVASSVKTERDARVRELYDQSLKLEAEARSIDGLSTELDRVRADIKDLRAERKEMSEKLTDIDGDIARTRSQLKELPELKAEIEAMKREIKRGRAAIEYERKMHSNNFGLSEAMEKHMISLAREAEKLRSELAEKRSAMAAANPGAGYASAIPQQRNLEGAGYGGNPLTDQNFAVHQATFDANPGYGPYGPPTT